MNFIEYAKLRRMAEIDNSLLSDEHACRRGCSVCCEAKVPVTSTDAAYVQNAVRRGDIPPEVVLAAKQKADTKNRSCPFLAEGSCTIYEQRPLICIITGYGAIARSEKQLTLINQPDFPGLPAREVSTTMCKEGAALMGKSGTILERDSFTDMQKITDHAKRHRFGATRDLAKWLTV
jgi:hypothetical protein